MSNENMADWERLGCKHTNVYIPDAIREMVRILAAADKVRVSDWITKALADRCEFWLGVHGLNGILKDNEHVFEACRDLEDMRDALLASRVRAHKAPEKSSDDV